MKNIEKELLQLSKDISKYHIPRWQELPDIDLYMDQVISFIEHSIGKFSNNATEKIITPSMINNYVKLNLIPKPIKKRYNKGHLAYLIAISILKQVLTIQEVRDGILFQAKINGGKDAYNLFCDEQEKALASIINQINLGDQALDVEKITTDNLAIKMSTMAFASKMIAEKTIELQKTLSQKQSNES
ncbi:MAG: DUF1836 domain-containing protein, partial [Epulopiscium sp.]|nr:DUF1836 domain-containing protein [Candidatus Epulonipiscium sp.]